MEVKWIGNTSFLIKTSLGRRIILDPIQIDSSIKNYDFNFDIITFSHMYNKDIVNFSGNKKVRILNSICSFENEYIKIESYKTYRDNVNGYKRGENIIYLLNCEGYRICHLGLLGHLLDKDLISKIYRCDILFIPIGGNFCLDGKLASKLIKHINPKIIIPMAFRSSYDYLYLDGPYKFLSNMKNTINLNNNKLHLDDFKNHPNSTVIIMSDKDKELL